MAAKRISNLSYGANEVAGREKNGSKSRKTGSREDDCDGAACIREYVLS